MWEKREFMGMKCGLALREEHWLGVLENKCGGRYLCFIGSKREGAGENRVMTSFIICTAHRIVFVWMRMKCIQVWGIYRREEKYIQGFGWETWREDTTLKNYVWCEDNINIDVAEIGWEVVDWICQAQNNKVVGFCQHGNEPGGGVCKMQGFFMYLRDC